MTIVLDDTVAFLAVSLWECSDGKCGEVSLSRTGRRRKESARGGCTSFLETLCLRELPPPEGILFELMWPMSSNSASRSSVCRATARPKLSWSRFICVEAANMQHVNTMAMLPSAMPT